MALRKSSISGVEFIIHFRKSNLMTIEMNFMQKSPIVKGVNGNRISLTLKKEAKFIGYNF